jgi:TPR repeat protein
MAADLLIDGQGCARDPARAVRLLHAAAERGHRMARQYLREWLDQDTTVGR